MKQLVGRIYGGLQLVFWVVLLIWIFLTIPLHLYYTQSPYATQFPTWLRQLYSLSWVDWRIGAIIISTFSVILMGIALIWAGWLRMHSISSHRSEEMDKQNEKRLDRVKKFSKVEFLRMLREDAQKYRQQRIK